MQRTTFRRSAFILLMSSLAVSGCQWPTYFAGPISEPDAKGIDARLEGAWYAVPKPKDWAGETSALPIWYLNIGRSEDLLLQVALIVTSGQPPSMDMKDYTIVGAKAWPSVVDGKVFYTVFIRNTLVTAQRHRCSVADEPCYFIARASFRDDDTFDLRFVGGESVKKLVKDGKVPGKELDDRDENYVLDISGAEIASLLRDYSEDELFQFWDGPLIFRRLKLTVTEQ